MTGTRRERCRRMRVARPVGSGRKPQKGQARGTILLFRQALGGNQADGSGWHGQLGRSRRQRAAEFRHGRCAHQKLHSRRTQSGGRVARPNGPVDRSTPTSTASSRARPCLKRPASQGGQASSLSACGLPARGTACRIGLEAPERKGQRHYPIFQTGSGREPCRRIRVARATVRPSKASGSRSSPENPWWRRSADASDPCKSPERAPQDRWGRAAARTLPTMVGTGCRPSVTSPRNSAPHPPTCPPLPITPLPACLPSGFQPAAQPVGLGWKPQKGQARGTVLLFRQALGGNHADGSGWHGRR